MPVYNPAPELKLEFAPTSLPFALSPVYVDITKYLRTTPIQIRQGRNQDTDDFDVGTMSFDLDNRTGAFTPENTASPYYPYIVPNKRMRLSAVYKGVTYPLYTGYVDQWLPSFPAKGFDAVVSVSCSDMFEILANREFKSLTLLDNYSIVGTNIGLTFNYDPPIPKPFSFTTFSNALLGAFMEGSAVFNGSTYQVIPQAQFTGAYNTPTSYTTAAGAAFLGAINTITVFGTFPSGTNISAWVNVLPPTDVFNGSATLLNMFGIQDRSCSTYLQNTTLPLITNFSGSLLDALRRLLSAADGLLYVNQSGTLVAESRFDRLLKTTPQATYTDVSNDGNLSYADVDFAYGKSQIRNTITVTRNGASSQTVIDNTSFNNYGSRTYSKTVDTSTDYETIGIARDRLLKKKDPHLYFPDMVIQPFSQDGLFEQIFVTYLSTRIRVQKAGIAKDCFVEGVQHTISERGLVWETHYGLSSASDATNNYWVLGGDPAYSVLGSTTRLVY